MRLRIQTLSPLPEVKAWFIPDLQDAQQTVFDLKGLLCRGITQLRTNRIDAEQLTLLLDGFELLDDSPVSVVRDEDLIVVKMAYHRHKTNLLSPPLSRKRKRNSSDFDCRPLSSRQMSSTHQYIPTLEESSSDSDSTSDSSTSSAETSTSSSDSPPTILPVSNVPMVPQLGKDQPAKEPLHQPSQTTTHVPPGQGKPSTHSRNQRRKKKREHEKLVKAGLLNQPKGISEANKLPLGSSRTSIPPSALVPPPSNVTHPVPSSTHDIISVAQESLEPEPDAASSSSKYIYLTSDQVMMGTLRNKNKKKGFKQSMSGPIPRKIVFPNQNQIGESDATFDAHAPDNQALEASSRRLVPPSELQHSGLLPSNVFVTSVDVEEHIWGSSASQKKKGKKRKSAKRYDDNGYEEYEDDIQELPYDDGTQAEGAIPENSTEVDWDKAEKLWEASSLVEDVRLAKGVIVGWKELAINPKTFTPEMLLFLARVVTVVQEGDGDKINFRRLQRPGASEAAIAFGVSNEGAEVDLGGEEEEECTSLADMVNSQWRIIDM